MFNKILHSHAMYCRKEMVKILKCYLIPKKSYGALSKGAIFYGQPCIYRVGQIHIQYTCININTYTVQIHIQGWPNKYKYNTYIQGWP